MARVFSWIMALFDIFCDYLNEYPCMILPTTCILSVSGTMLFPPLSGYLEFRSLILPFFLCLGWNGTNKRSRELYVLRILLQPIHWGFVFLWIYHKNDWIVCPSGYRCLASTSESCLYLNPLSVYKTSGWSFFMFMFIMWYIRVGIKNQDETEVPEILVFGYGYLLGFRWWKTEFT